MSCLLLMSAALAVTAPVDIMSDTWVATDGLGRKLPTFEEVGGPRTDRTIGLFYFQQHRPCPDGPYDITKILAADPKAMERNSPLFGWYGCGHHWGESLFGYYLATDKSVCRKHAQMLSDAGVDVIIFDVTNGDIFENEGRVLMDTFAEIRAAGGKTPQIAYLCPFDPNPSLTRCGTVLLRLWETVYRPGVHPDLWFRWEGKPLVLAHPSYCSRPSESAGFVPFWSPGTRELKHKTAIQLQEGHTLGQLVVTTNTISSVTITVPTWGLREGCELTFAVRKDGPQGAVVAKRRVINIRDNAFVSLDFGKTCPPGSYYLEISEPKNWVGWWLLHPDDPSGKVGGAYADGKPCPGCRTFSLLQGFDEEGRRMANFFTFRKPNAGYGFKRETKPDHDPNDDGSWCWLQVHPQHVFCDANGKKEMTGVSVAQNSRNEQVSAMSEPDVRGRRWHDGANDPDPKQLARGPNFQEQWERALKLDPPFIFVTQWNEWFAGRFKDWLGWSQPGGVFVDNFDAEHSRDCEPVKGHWGDAYYWQLVSNIRRYKGVRKIPTVKSRPIAIDRKFDDWKNVEPEFRDTPDDQVRRDADSYGRAARYVDSSGRNDIVAAKVSLCGDRVCFYVRTSRPMTSPDGGDWMRLFIDIDRNADTGWLGYDFVVQREAAANRTVIRRHMPDHRGRDGQFVWWWGEPDGVVEVAVSGCEMELAVPVAAFGAAFRPDGFDFKWEDHALQAFDWTDFTLHGDAAPNDRYNYRAIFK